MEKYCRVGQTTDNNVVHAHCMLDTYSHKHIIKICSTDSFSTATMVARKRLNVTFIRTLRVIFLVVIVQSTYDVRRPVQIVELVIM